MSNETTQEKEINRLKFFPIMMYAIVMGLSGLTISYQKAGQWLGLPKGIGFVLLFLTTTVFFVITIIYIIKYSKYPMAVKKEFGHPVRINFFAAISISMLLLAIGYKEHYPTISAILWYPGTALHLFFTLYTIRFWINNNLEIAHSNPAWFIPIVGNVLVPVAGVGFASEFILNFYFSIGMFFWIVMFTIIINRIIFHHQLADKFMPTFFILLAPPSVGVIAYFKLTGQIDFFAHFLYNIALFLTIFLAFMYKNFVKIKFFISWWAFTFPLTAMTTATMLMYKKTGDIVMYNLSYLLLAVTTMVIGTVVYQTIVHIKKHDICIQE